MRAYEKKNLCTGYSICCPVSKLFRVPSTPMSTLPVWKTQPCKIDPPILYFSPDNEFLTWTILNLILTLWYCRLCCKFCILDPVISPVQVCTIVSGDNYDKLACILYIVRTPKLGMNKILM